jgi:hypothetical protein
LKTTKYFQNKVLHERPYLQMKWLEEAIAHPLEVVRQPNGRLRHWAFIEDFQKYLRVVTLEDGETVHNAFFDRGYKRSKR